MPRIFKLWSIVVVALAVLCPSVHAAGLNDVVATVQEPFQADTPAARRIHDYRADFLQEAQIVSLDRVQKASGKVAVRFGGVTHTGTAKVSFRWEYQQPTVQQIVSDGETVWMYLPDNKQVLVTDAALLSQERDNDPMTFLTGLGNLSRDFLISWGEPKQTPAGNYRMVLQPRHSSSVVSQLIMVVDQHAVESFLQYAEKGTTDRLYFPILAATIVDTNGNRSVFTFENIEVNPGTKAQDFVFKIPDGVDIVHPTKEGFGF